MHSGIVVGLRKVPVRTVVDVLPSEVDVNPEDGKCVLADGLLANSTCPDVELHPDAPLGDEVGEPVLAEHRSGVLGQTLPKFGVLLARSIILCACLAIGAADAHAEIPALSREFSAEFDDSLPPAGSPGWRYLSARASVGGFARSPRPGSSTLPISDGKLGGRVAIEVRSGAFSAGADGVVDGVHLDADPREYPGRVHLGAIAPRWRTALRVDAGFNRDGYRGADARSLHLLLRSDTWIGLE